VHRALNVLDQLVDHPTLREHGFLGRSALEFVDPLLDLIIG
jgi:hypothetical protein